METKSKQQEEGAQKKDLFRTDQKKELRDWERQSRRSSDRGWVPARRADQRTVHLESDRQELTAEQADRDKADSRSCKC
jgi:hypothetical protein